MRLRLTDAAPAAGDPLGEEFDSVLALRRKDADEFYAAVIPEKLSADEKSVMRQAFAGMLWSKQFYKYDVRRWLDGRPAAAAPARRPPERPQQRLAARLQRRHPLDARHLGVSVVRRVGPRVSLRRRCRSWTRSSPRTSSS